MPFAHRKWKCQISPCLILVLGRVFFFDWNLFSLTRDRLPFAVQDLMKSNHQENRFFPISFPPSILKPINFACYAAHTFLPWDENFYQYLTFHFRTNDFIIIFLAFLAGCGGWSFFSLTVCYLQAEKISWICGKYFGTDVGEKKETLDS